MTTHNIALQKRIRSISSWITDCSGTAYPKMGTALHVCGEQGDQRSDVIDSRRIIEQVLRYLENAVKCQWRAIGK